MEVSFHNICILLVNTSFELKEIWWKQWAIFKNSAFLVPKIYEPLHYQFVSIGRQVHTCKCNYLRSWDSHGIVRSLSFFDRTLSGLAFD